MRIHLKMGAENLNMSLSRNTVAEIKGSTYPDQVGIGWVLENASLRRLWTEHELLYIALVPQFIHCMYISYRLILYFIRSSIRIPLFVPLLELVDTFSN